MQESQKECRGNRFSARHKFLGLVFAVLLSACGGDGDGVLEIEGSLDGISFADATPSDPIELRPFQESDLRLTLTNTSSSDVQVDHIRLEGEMLDATFVAYDAGISVVVPAGGSEDLRIPLDFFDLDRQAHGYLRTKLKAYDSERTELGSTGFAVDVRGKPFSPMGVFAFLLLAITLLSLALDLWAMARRRLPANRFVRGMRFMIPGLGIGLLIAVAFSLLRIFPLPSSTWVPLVLIPTAIGFALGYIAPGPDDVLDDLDDDMIDELIERAEARATAGSIRG